jgi:hypothetical protein
MLCDCPVPTALPLIPVSSCPESMGQIQKIVFQRIYSTGTTKNKFTIASSNPNLLASWTTFLSASDGTRVVQTPYLENPTNEPGAVRTYGGGNETRDGIPITLGSEPSPFTARINQSAQDTIKQLKKYMCEEVGVFLIDQFKKIGGISDDVDNPTEVYPIPIQQLFISDKALGMYESPDYNMIEFHFAQNWSDNFYLIDPSDFNPLTDLASPSS